MKTAFASGKGGTGKTTVSVNLAKILAEKQQIQYMDCDVEEPNGHLFLNPHIKHSVYVNTVVPVIDEKKCTHCGKCASFCAFSAIASLPKTTLVFEELCHSCGGCRLLCPEKAITESERRIGIIERGDANGIDFIHGKLDVGKPMSSPLIKALDKYADKNSLTIIDAPPGANCTTMSCLQLCDRIVLVAEPTPFGFNDLKIIAEMAGMTGKPYSVIINRWNMGDDSIEKWCFQNGIRILGKIPYDNRIAELYSNGMIISDFSSEFRKVLEKIGKELLPEVQK